MKHYALIFALVSTGAFAKDFIVKTKEGMQRSFLNQAARSLSIKKNFKTSFGDFAVVSGDERTIHNVLRSNSMVEYYEEDGYVDISPIEEWEVGEDFTPWDDLFPRQWALRNSGKNTLVFATGVKGKDINIEPAWGVSKIDRIIKVAVIDTGIDYEHKDLKGNMWVNIEEANGTPGVDDDDNGFIDDIHGYDFSNNDGDPMDDNAHGTHCAGVIGATHTGEGIMGIMEQVKLVGIKFLSKSGSGSWSGAVQSIDYAIRVGVDIMSNSWGGTGESQALTDAVARANEAGILFVAAAGNSQANNDTASFIPANINVENVVSVGSMNGSGKRSYFSNYGSEKVHVFAPGSNILSTVPGDDYKKFSGTSMAAPHVSGILGLYLSQGTSRNIKEAKERLITTSAPENDLKDLSVSGGRVDTFRFLENIKD